jgi:hypothetical protein
MPEKQKQMSGAERVLWSDAIVEAFDEVEHAYNAARDGGAPPEVVEHLQHAKDEAFQARVKGGC